MLSAILVAIPLFFTYAFAAYGAATTGIEEMSGECARNYGSAFGRHVPFALRSEILISRDRWYSSAIELDWGKKTLPCHSS